MSVGEWGVPATLVGRNGPNSWISNLSRYPAAYAPGGGSWGGFGATATSAPFSTAQDGWLYQSMSDGTYQIVGTPSGHQSAIGTTFTSGSQAYTNIANALKSGQAQSSPISGASGGGLTGALGSLFSALGGGTSAQQQAQGESVAIGLGAQLVSGVSNLIGNAISKGPSLTTLTRQLATATAGYTKAIQKGDSSKAAYYRTLATSLQNQIASYAQLQAQVGGVGVQGVVPTTAMTTSTPSSSLPTWVVPAGLVTVAVVVVAAIVMNSKKGAK